MKRFLLVLLALAMCLSMAACGEEEVNDNGSSSSVAESSAVNTLAGKYMLYSMSEGKDTFDYATLVAIGMADSYLDLKEDGAFALLFADEDLVIGTYDKTAETLTANGETIPFAVDGDMISLVMDGAVATFTKGKLPDLGSSESSPAISIPDLDSSDVSEPEESKPEESKPESSKPEESKPETDKPENPSEIAMSDDWEDFTIKIEGVVYQLPCKLDDFKANGWTISSTNTSEDELIAGNSYASYTMANSGKKIDVYSYNLSGNAKALKDCLVGAISWNNYNKTTAEIAKGITTNSTIDEIIAAYGTPSSQNSYTDYDTVRFESYDSSSNVYMSFSIYHTDTKWSSITVRNFKKTENDKTETNTEAPEYLSEYVKPEKLADELFTPMVKIGNEIYQFPAPVSEFLNNGWKITQQEGPVVAGGGSYITVKKGTSTLYLNIDNFATYQTTPQNCVVTHATVESDYISAARIPGGITFDTTKAQMDALLEKGFSYYESAYYYSYTYSDYKSGISVSVYVDIKTEKVYKFSVTCDKWTYGEN